MIAYKKPLKILFSQPMQLTSYIKSMDAPDRSSSTERPIKRQRQLPKNSGDDTIANLHGIFREPSGHESIEFKVRIFPVAIWEPS
jgi:hypothetical protein